MSTKQLYQKEIEGKLEALDAQMAEMQAKADKASADLKVQYYEQLRTLSERREDQNEQRIRCIARS